MNAIECPEPEVEAVLATIYQRYHYDFRQYARPLVSRRMARACALLRVPDLSELRQRIEDPGAFATLLGCLTIQVSDLFRDPAYFRAIRSQVVPHLATYPSIKIWVAGCGAGEEAYSLAIVLAEAGLLERSLIYATDIDPASLRTAAAGAYPLDRLQGFTRNYFEAEGRASLSDYYTAAYGRAAFVPGLRKHIVFSDHCLATDGPFAEVQLISCRNVLIYFDLQLQARALGLFRASLCSRGFLGLGSKERLPRSGAEPTFSFHAKDERIYRLSNG